MNEEKESMVYQARPFRLSSLQSIIVKSIAVVAAVILVYFQDLQLIFADALYSEATSYILLVPVLCAYVFYRKRNMLIAAAQDENRPHLGIAKYASQLIGALLAIAAIMVYLFGSQTFVPLQYHLASLPIFAAGLVLVLFNPQTLRQAIYPIAFTAFLTPPPADLLNATGSTLSIASTEASNAMLNLIGIRSTISYSFGSPAIDIIGAGNTPTSFAIDVACSGMYSLIGFAVFAVFVAYIVRDKMWKKLTILAIGFPLIYLLNIIRITSIVLIGYQWGSELALNAFHLMGGTVLVFLGTLALLVLSEKALKTQIFSKKKPRVACRDCGLSDKARYCFSCGRIRRRGAKLRPVDIARIAAIIALAALIAYLQNPVYAMTRSPSQIMVQTPSGEQGDVRLLPQFQGYDLAFAYRDTNFEQASGQDFSLVYIYYPQSQSNITVRVAVEIAKTSVQLHMWENCLITAPLERGSIVPITQLDLRDISILENPTIKARYFAFYDKDANLTQVVLYWYESSLFEMGNSTQQRQVKTSIIAYADSPDEVSGIEAQILPFARDIAAYWEPIKTWGAMDAISQNGLTLSATTITLIAALSVFFELQTLIHRKNNLRVYEKLPEKDRRFIDALRSSGERRDLTIEDAALAMQKIDGEPTDRERLRQKLGELESLGLLQDRILNKQDEPIQGWRVQI
ncbi:MAG: exosortase/archaeosortase family protein [Candidatus Bathyarchaeia archaeon]